MCLQGTHGVRYSSTWHFFTCTKNPSHAPQAGLIFVKTKKKRVVSTMRIILFPFIAACWFFQRVCE